MARITIEVVGLRRVSRQLRRLAAAGANTTDLHRRIGEFVLRSTRDRFERAQAPDGTPWKPLAASTVRRKGHSRIGFQDGHLFGTLNYRAASHEVLVGSPRIYAGTFHFGAARGAFGATRTGSPIPWGDIPARPILGVSSGDRAEIEAITRDWIADLLRR